MPLKASNYMMTLLISNFAHICPTIMALYEASLSLSKRLQKKLTLEIELSRIVIFYDVISTFLKMSYTGIKFLYQYNK